MRVDEVVNRLRELVGSKEVPKNFVKWLRLYIETLAMDPSVCECLLDSSCALSLDTMLVELMKFENYAFDSHLDNPGFVRRLARCIEILDEANEAG